MQYTIETVKDVTDLHTNTLRRLKELTQRELSASCDCGMKYLLRSTQQQPWTWTCKKAFIARNTSGKIIAWGLLTKSRYHVDYEFNVYVAGQYRKRGIGKELFREAHYALSRKQGKLTFHSWSNQSTKFYYNVAVKNNSRFKRRLSRSSLRSANC